MFWDAAVGKGGKAESVRGRKGEWETRRLPVLSMQSRSFPALRGPAVGKGGKGERGTGCDVWELGLQL